MELIKFSIFENHKDKIKHALSTRHGGISKGHFDSLNLGLGLGDEDTSLRHNYSVFLLAAEVGASNLCLADQVHNNKVKVITENDGALGFDRVFDGIDGFITNQAGFSLLVRFADCQGILMYDKKKHVIAALHCGWKGNNKNIIRECIQKMREFFVCDPKDIIMGISQSLGPCCAEFSDPYKELIKDANQFVCGPKKRHVNLWKLSIFQALKEGVLPENIEILGECTKCNTNKYFSYRAGNKKSGHMAAVIELL